jgi:drug/metabolite transporter (DMT)-like permease
MFAGLFTLSKTALLSAEPFFLVGSRMLLAGLLLVGYELIIRKRTYTLKRKQLISLFILGLFAFYITNTSEVWGLQYMSSAKACLIYSLSPFVAAALAFPLLKEKLTSKKILGLCIGFLGILPLLWVETGTNDIIKDLILISWPDMALILAVFSSAYGWILLKSVMKENQFSAIFANGIAMLVGGLFALTHSYLSGESWTPLPIVQNQWGLYIECTLWMTVISNIVCYNLYGHLLKKFSATFMAFAGLVTPLFASLFGWFFLDEIITWHFYVAMIIFSAGLTIFYLEELPSFNIYQKTNNLTTTN